jgi:ribosomal protein S12 methylthiotransferase
LELLRRIAGETEVEKLRLMYCYPELVTDELLEEVAKNPKIAKYMDIPIQHADDRILKRMNRRSTHASLRALFQKIRAASPEIVVRTTVMVGFPGETESEFSTLYDFIGEYRPHHVGVFAYSKEAGTPSAKLTGHVKKSEKLRRVNALGELHLKNTRERNQKTVGKILSVVYEGIDYDRNLFIGRPEFSAPEIDTYVYFKGAFADVGKTYDVKITGYEGYDLLGELVEK